jgi:putative ABC transport system substrate-binding protein
MHQLAGGFPAAASRRIAPQRYQQSKFRASLSCEDMTMRRREVIAFCGAAAAAALPRVAHAQARRRLGVLTTANDLQWGAEKGALLEELAKLGWTEGETLQIDYRFGAGDVERTAAAAGELVNLRPDVILARSTPAVRALLVETRTIPIVFISASDPIGENFAASMARPGGNVTGFTNIEASMSAKWLDLLKQAVPGIRKVVVLFNPKLAVGGGAYFLREIEAAAPGFAVTLQTIPVYTAAEMEAALTALSREPDAGLVVVPDQFIVANRALLIDFAARHRLPAIYAFRNMAIEGGLMAYGVNLVGLYRRSTAYVDRILKGAVVGELPIQAPTGFELVVNLKTAKAMDLEIPRQILLLADEVIE